jgi:hypothetical protein
VSVSAIYEAVTRATQSRLGLRVISAEEMFVASQEGLVARVRDCGSDPACIAAKLRMFDARMGLVVVLNFQLAPPVYSLQLLDTDAGRKVADRVGEVGPGDDVLEVIAHHADALLDAEGFVKSGRILVEVDPPRAQLRLTPGLDPDPGTPNVFTVAPGRYAVDASLEGFAPAQTEVEVRSGETTTARLRLDEQVSLWRTPWPWVAIGAAVVGGHRHRGDGEPAARPLPLHHPRRGGLRVSVAHRLSGAGCPCCRAGLAPGPAPRARPPPADRGRTAAPPGRAARRRSGMGASQSSQWVRLSPWARRARARFTASSTLASICSWIAPSLYQPPAMGPSVLAARRAPRVAPCGRCGPADAPRGRPRPPTHIAAMQGEC